MLKQLSRNRLGVIGVAAAVFALLLSFMLTAAAHAQADGAMSIAIDGSGVDCDGDECIVDNGTDFTLTVTIDGAPSEGYIGVQTQVVYQNLIYSPTDDAEEEMLINMDGFPGVSARSYPGTPNYAGLALTVNHGQTSGTPPSFATSHYTGPAIQIALTCTDDYSRNEVELGPHSVSNGLGSGFKLPLAAGATNVPAGDSLLVHCGVPPTPIPVPPSAATPTLAAQGVPGTGMAGNDGDTSTGLWIAIGSLLAAGVAASAGTLAWRRNRG
ncbi:MAG: hypothetical protein WEB04_01690 [Dehalococcoidia bacterium]